MRCGHLTLIRRVKAAMASGRRIYFWVWITAKTPFNSGLQRVARCLGKSLEDLGYEIIPIKADESGDNVVPLSYDEARHFERWGGPTARFLDNLPKPNKHDWLFIPELAAPLRPNGSSPTAWAKGFGMRSAAIFYDMIPLHHREIYTDYVVNSLIDFWRTYPDLELAIPISKTVEEDLKKFLLYHGLKCPPIKTILLPGEIPETKRSTSVRQYPPGEPFNLVAVGTWEPRKNYPRLIRAVGAARNRGVDIRLTIVGRKCSLEYPELEREIIACAKKVGDDVVRLNGFLEDNEVNQIMASAHATVFGSWLEGFGLPVTESIWNGLPCICHNGSSIGEIAPGGGTIMVDMQDECAIADAYVRIATEQGLYQVLAQEAVTRPVKTWEEYGRQVAEELEKHLPRPLPLILRYSPFGREFASHF